MRVRLVRPAGARLEEFIAAVRRSRALHADFVAPPDTPRSYRRFVRQARLVTEARFFSVTTDKSDLAGVVTLGAIARVPLPSATIGYYAFEPYAARGLMAEAVGLVLAHAFGRLGLERIDASIRPDNDRSRRLAARLGFRPDGSALHDVRVGDRWFAHERWALEAEEWAASLPRAEGRRARPEHGSSSRRPFL